MHPQDQNLCDEAEEFINKIGRIIDLQASLFKKQVDGMNVSKQDMKRVENCIDEAIMDCFWEGIKNAKKVMQETSRREK